MGLLSFFRRKAKKHILDGPGMENTNRREWSKLDVSCSHSYAQYNFGFDVIDNGMNMLAFGECRDEEGTIYESREGIELTSKMILALRELKLDELDDVKLCTDPVILEAVILDEPSYSLKLTYFKDLQTEKSVTQETVIQIYEILLPLFKKRGTEIN